MEFSFFSMISQASLVAKIVLCILVLMSVGSWGMMIQKTLALNAAYRKALHAYNKQAYAKLAEEFHKGVEAIVKEMNQAMPADVKEANKSK